MSDELKPCPVCGEKPQVNSELSTRPLASCVNPVCWLSGLAFHPEDWQERPLEDALSAELAAMTAERDSESRWAAEYLGDLIDTRAELAASQAEVERLRGIVRKVEWSVVVFGEIGRGYRQCPVCMNALSEGHDEECPFYQWEGGA